MLSASAEPEGARLGLVVRSKSRNEAAACQSPAGTVRHADLSCMPQPVLPPLVPGQIRIAFRNRSTHHSHCRQYLPRDPVMMKSQRGGVASAAAGRGARRGVHGVGDARAAAAGAGAAAQAVPQPHPGAVPAGAAAPRVQPSRWAVSKGRQRKAFCRALEGFCNPPWRQCLLELPRTYSKQVGGGTPVMTCTVHLRKSADTLVVQSVRPVHVQGSACCALMCRRCCFGDDAQQRSRRSAEATDQVAGASDADAEALAKDQIDHAVDAVAEMQLTSDQLKAGAPAPSLLPRI